MSDDLDERAALDETGPEPPPNTSWMEFETICWL